MRRVSRMSFAPGMYVFPGGRLDSVDSDARAPIVGTPDTRAARADDDLARGLLVCAIRETFEEAGVLLAVGDRWSDASTEERRCEIESGRDFCEFLREHGLVIDADAVPMWSHWVTPEREPKRFDVRFYAAALPDGAVAHDISGESDHATWVRPRDAIELFAAGDMPMLPPTIATLRELAAHDDAAGALRWARGRELRPLLPHPTESGWVLVDANDRSLVLSATEARTLREVDGIHGWPRP